MRIATGLSLVLSSLALGLAHPAPAGDAAVEALLREGVGHNLAGDYDAADRTWARLRALAPGSPAAPVHEIGTLFSRIAFRNEDRSVDPEIQRRADEALGLAQARLGRSSRDAEALYYRGYTRFQQARLHAMRGDMYTAGSTGEQGRKDLERALAIDPGLVRAKLPLGMYLYYATVMPGAVRAMDFLWFVPKGSAEQGLGHLRELFAGGGVLGDEAAWVLSDIYEEFIPEKREEGLALARALVARYPRNELLRMQELFTLARMQRPAETRATARALVTRLDGRPEHARLRAVARVWEARAAIAEGDAAGGRAALAALESHRGDGPPWLEAFVVLAQGQLADAAGDRAGARARYEAVVALEPPARSGWASSLAEGYLERPFRAGVAAAD